MINKRRLAAALAVALWAAAPLHASWAQEPVWRHSLSLLDEPRYGSDFKHFDYVNPQAPKGGVARLADDGTFDSLNFVIPRGTVPLGIGLVYDTLMSASLDEVAAEYGLLAEAVSHPADFSSVSFRLRPQARWHDGRPVTVEDVIFSFDVVKEHNPQLAFYYRHVTAAEKTGEREVTFRFDQPGNRELPQIVGQFQVLPKHYWEGTDANGNRRDITSGTLEPPLGSGPYRVKTVAPGRTVAYERVPDYWGRDLPVNVGTNNFDEIRYEYYRDETVMLEAFKADQYDFRQEASAKNWATAYDFPAVREGNVSLEMFPIKNAGVMQAFAFNTRREKFQDARVRRAFNLAFDFEEMNASLFYGQYQRIDSYFFGTELAARGLPEGKELAILNEFKADLPPEVFTKVYENPKGGDARSTRRNLVEAQKLLEEAGWAIRNGRLTNVKSGEPMTVEFLIVSPAFERVVLRYQQSLERLGVQSTLRLVDSSQYVNRVRGFDYDIITASWGQSLSPGNEQLDFWGSAAADREGSRNYAGIKSPVVDRLIQRLLFTKDREDLVAATRALDRVLLASNWVVPQWALLAQRTARWNRFLRPDKMPEYGAAAFPTIWWSKEAAASRAEAPR